MSILLWPSTGQKNITTGRVDAVGWCFGQSPPVFFFVGVLLHVQYLKNKRKKSSISVPGKMEGAISEKLVVD